MPKLKVYKQMRGTSGHAEIRMLLITFVGPGYGMGHYYRSVALCDTAIAFGVKAYVMSNHPNTHFSLNSLEQTALIEQAIDFTGANWVSIDVPYDVPTELIETIHAHGTKVLLLNGTRTPDDLAGADFWWNQDHPAKAILRPRLMETKRRRRVSINKWFVWGGSEDKLGICQKFVDWTDYPAWIMTTDMMPKVIESGNPAQVMLLADDAEMLHMMKLSGHAVVHYGMVTWELAYYGVKQWVFSSTEDHLRDALALQEYGLIRAYPHIGLPQTRADFVDFLSNDFTFQEENRPTGGGARNLLYDIIYFTTTGTKRVYDRANFKAKE